MVSERLMEDIPIHCAARGSIEVDRADEEDGEGRKNEEEEEEEEEEDVWEKRGVGMEIQVWLLCGVNGGLPSRDGARGGLSETTAEEDTLALGESGYARRVSAMF